MKNRDFAAVFAVFGVISAALMVRRVRSQQRAGLVSRDFFDFREVRPVGDRLVMVPDIHLARKCRQELDEGIELLKELGKWHFTGPKGEA